MISIKIKDEISSLQKDFNTNLLKPKNELYSKLWKSKNNPTLNPVVSRKLKEIADKILESLKIDVEPKDIIITGSIASYNWHDLSDIDLHILFDFEKINEDYELVKSMLDQTRINWNKTHNILISGKEVELYFQHAYEPHESNGVWSLLMDKWLTKPIKNNPELDLINTEKKAEGIARCIEHLYSLFKDKKYKEAYEYSGKIKNKIARMRKSGLQSEGIYSPENLAFKMLRNAGYLEKLSALKIEAYDRMMSIDIQERSLNENQAWRQYLKGENL